MVDRGQEDLRDRSLGELMSRLSEDTSTLVRKEIELARAELTQKGRQAGKGAGLLGGAGVAGLLALASFTAAAIALLDRAMATWVAALILALVWAAVAGVLALQGRNKVQEATPPVPEQAVDSTKEDVEWAKTRAKSARR